MNKTAKILAAAVLTASVAFFTYTQTAKAANLQESYIYLSRMETDIASGIEMIFAISTTNTMTSGGTITIEFPDGDDTNWCRTAGALTVTGVASSAADGTTAIASALNTASATASCTQGGVGTGDTITILNAGAMTAGTVYGFEVVGSTGVLGTDDTAGDHFTSISVDDGVNTDTATEDVELITDDTVTITAVVENAPSVTCSISTTTINLGTLYAGGAYSTAGHNLSTSTSANANGYYWTAYGTGDGATAGLYKSTATTDLIPSAGPGTVDLTSAAEGFGVTLSEPTGVAVPTNFDDGTPGTFGLLDVGFAGAQLVADHTGAETTGDTISVTYGARAAAAAEQGTYTEDVTFVCGGYY